ncbi:MAG: hypothetical protein M3N13_06825, partial [Candidatus Eremiobacteraeota bacterium]|nr:hypothetical protein [Candidatus Eremiobacteraeota bacterium]
MTVARTRSEGGARLATADGAPAIRVKMFDYGVRSVRLILPFAREYDAFAGFTRRIRNDDALPALPKPTKPTHSHRYRWRKTPPQ